MGVKQSSNIKDEFLEDHLLIPSQANLKRDPSAQLEQVVNRRGLLSARDDRKIWGIFASEKAGTHSASCVVIEAKWNNEPDVCLIGTGFLIGDLNDPKQSTQKKVPSGYSVIRSQFCLTAAHNIFHDKYGLADNIRLRVPNTITYHENRVSPMPMKHGCDPNRQARFVNCGGEPMVHPQYKSCPDSFSGADIGLIRLDQVFERISLPLQVCPFDWKPEVLTVGGYPGQRDRMYHLHVSSSRYKRVSDGKIIDTGFNFREIEPTENGFALIKYSNQVTCGMSGGPVSGYLDLDHKPGCVVGIHSNEGEEGELNSGTLITEPVFNWIKVAQQGRFGKRTIVSELNLVE